MTTEPPVTTTPRETLAEVADTAIRLSRTCDEVVTKIRGDKVAATAVNGFAIQLLSLASEVQQTTDLLLGHAPDWPGPEPEGTP